MNPLQQLRKQSTLFRKSLDLSGQLARALRRVVASPDQFVSAPPVMVNSFPKSGTHLLHQILGALPSIRDYGTFLASIPSFPHRQRPARQIRRRIHRIVPGELLRAHLFFDPEIAECLRARGVVHYFIYRDLRDVAVSEAHYLTYVNRYHSLHRYFRALPSAESRLSLSILGTDAASCPYEYPNIAERFGRYRGWLCRSDVCSVRYEDLVSEDNWHEVARLVRFYCDRVSARTMSTAIVESALARVDPRNSHTFRKGGVGGWRVEFNAEHKKQMHEVAGILLGELGYGRSNGWPCLGEE